MFIDYITLMLINLAAGLALLAGYMYWGLGHSNQRRWIPGFGVVGAIALVTGLHMTLTWPVPGSFNIAFGETTVLFGVLFVGTSLTLAMGWELFTLGVYGFFAGLVSLLIGVRIINLELIPIHLLAGGGFILVGLGGIFAAPALSLKENRFLQTIGAVVLIVAALIFAYIGLHAYWTHLIRNPDGKVALFYNSLHQ
jgi:putative membrane protein